MSTFFRGGWDMRDWTLSCSLQSHSWSCCITHPILRTLPYHIYTNNDHLSTTCTSDCLRTLRPGSTPDGTATGGLREEAVHTLQMLPGGGGGQAELLFACTKSSRAYLLTLQVGALSCLSCFKEKYMRFLLFSGLCMFDTYLFVSKP